MFKLAATLALMLGVASATPMPSPNAVGDGLTKRATDFWYANMDHTGPARGYAPDLDNDFSYQVFKAVRAGDGPGIQAAINDNGGSRRHGQWLASQPRVSLSQARLDMVLYLINIKYIDMFYTRLSTFLPAHIRSAQRFA